MSAFGLTPPPYCGRSLSMDPAPASRSLPDFAACSLSLTCRLLGYELDGLGLGPEVLARAVDPDVHALRDVVGLLQGQVPEGDQQHLFSRIARLFLSYGRHHFRYTTGVKLFRLNPYILQT